MKISIEDIRKLRRETKSGVMEVRQALQKTKGNFKKAKEWLMRKSLTKAEAKAARATGEGIIEAYIHSGGKAGSIVKIGCETDFVAKTQELKVLAHEIALQVVSMEPKNIDELLDQDYIRDDKKKVGDLIKETIAKVGENIKVVDFKALKI